MDNGLDGTAIDKIDALVRKVVAPVEIKGEHYAPAAMMQIQPKPDPTPAPLEVGTLGSFIEYITAEMDKEEQKEGCFVHIADPRKVELLSPLFGLHQQRFCYIRAEACAVAFQYGTWFDPESFLIKLMTEFMPTPAVSGLMKLVGNLRDEAVRTLEDDGVTQVAKARQGLSLAAELAVPNPIKLRPYDLFREVVSPEGLYILRLRGGGSDRKPTCALFEADAIGWELQAIDAVRDYLEKELPDGTVILA